MGVAQKSYHCTAGQLSGLTHVVLAALVQRKFGFLIEKLSATRATLREIAHARNFTSMHEMPQYKAYSC